MMVSLRLPAGAFVCLLACGYLVFRRFRHKLTGARSHKKYAKPEFKSESDDIKDSVPPQVVGEPQVVPPKRPPATPSAAGDEVDLLGLSFDTPAGGMDSSATPPADSEVELEILINSIVKDKGPGER